MKKKRLYLAPEERDVYSHGSTNQKISSGGAICLNRWLIQTGDELPHLRSFGRICHCVSRNISSRWDWSSRGSALLFSLILYASFLTFCSTALAQSPASLTGHVIDEQGANVAGADVRLRSREGLQLSTATDANGSFRFEDLGSGAYFVEVKAAGFATLTTAEIRLDRG